MKVIAGGGEAVITGRTRAGGGSHRHGDFRPRQQASDTGNCTIRVLTGTLSETERLNITLDDEYAEKLLRLAERVRVQPGTVARSLLSGAIDEADPDPRNVTELLCGIPGAHERAQLGARQAEAGETVSLDDL